MPSSWYLRQPSDLSVGTQIAVISRLSSHLFELRAPPQSVHLLSIGYCRLLRRMKKSRLGTEMAQMVSAARVSILTDVDVVQMSYRRDGIVLSRRAYGE